MAAAAVSCSLVCRGCLTNNRAVAVHSGADAVGSSTTTSTAGNKASLVWDPLHRRHVMLRSSRSSAYLSSASSAPSTSFSLSRDFTGMRKRRSAVPRASGRDEQEEEVEQMSEISRIESESRSPSNVEKSFTEAPQSMWSHIVSSAAKPAVVAVMMALLLAQPVEDSLAASSGGRMGGKSFSSPSRPSAPSRSYSGGGGGGGGRAYSGGGGGVYVAPPIYGSPYGFSPFGYSPFYGGGYGGGAFLGPSVGFGGGGTIILAMIAFATLRAVVGFVRDRFRGDDEDRFDD